jgi:7-cyano-7-deazaguanine synthase
MAGKNRQNVLILVSGGIDSTACINYYIQQHFFPKSLFIDYGQIVNETELASAKKIASHYKLELDTLKINMSRNYGAGEIRGRNAFFIIAALMKYEGFSGIISIGIHSESPYYDTTEKFLTDINTLVGLYTDGTVRVDAPFLKWTKPMIYEYCKKNNVPIHLTYSCEQRNDQPCGECSSCLDRKAFSG